MSIGNVHAPSIPPHPTPAASMMANDAGSTMLVVSTCGSAGTSVAVLGINGLNPKPPVAVLGVGGGALTFKLADCWRQREHCLAYENTPDCRFQLIVFTAGRQRTAVTLPLGRARTITRVCRGKLALSLQQLLQDIDALACCRADGTALPERL